MILLQMFPIYIYLHIEKITTCLQELLRQSFTKSRERLDDPFKSLLAHGYKTHLDT